MKKFKFLFTVAFAMVMMTLLAVSTCFAEGVDANTISLIHMDGSDGSTTIQDEMKSDFWKVNGNAKLSTVNKKFGISSCLFDKTKDISITSRNTSDFNFSNIDCTIDGWFYFNSLYANERLFTINGASGIGGVYINSDKKIEFGVLGTSKRVGNTIIMNNNWYHIALVKTAGMTKLYLNGSVEISGEYGYGIMPTGDCNIQVGDNVSYGGPLDGYVDEFRISKIARWTDNFTPPTAPYSPSNIEVNGLTLNKTVDSITINGTGQLMATITPDNATNKAVIWKSDNEGVATVDSNGKVTGIKPGKATITATTTDGSNLSASCVVTVTDVVTPTPTDNTGNATLIITMTNGNIKQYSVSMTVVNDFISWYNNRSSGSNGNPYYKFDKTDSTQSTLKKTEYVTFDKISSFEVDQYSK